MKSAIYALLCFIFIISSLFQEVEACICSESFKGGCLEPRNEYCATQFRKRLNEQTAFNCTCVTSHSRAQCSCRLARKCTTGPWPC
uniref:S locus protein 11-54 n=2 Tax=Brassica campestris TaxID=3711 RepID=A8QZC7_BRACM|nr:S locus protein 11-54 [Brassica rapa]